MSANIATPRRPEIVSLGVDWITATTKTADATYRMLSWASECITVEMRTGNERRPWAMAGFHGHICGQVQAGFREDEGIVRLTSDYAARSWKTLYQLGDTVTRLDLQVTSKTATAPSKRVHADWKRAKRMSAKREKGAEVTIISKMRGGDTFYSGSRQSQLFGRCYDKAAQSKRPEWSMCVRHELQLNGKRAMLVARRINDARHPGDTIASCLQAFWAMRLGSFWLPCEGELPSFGSRHRPDYLQRLEWLRVAVGPSVRNLVKLGKSVELLQALGVRVAADGSLELDHVVQE